MLNRLRPKPRVTSNDLNVSDEDWLVELELAFPSDEELVLASASDPLEFTFPCKLT